MNLLSTPPRLTTAQSKPSSLNQIPEDIYSQDTPESSPSKIELKVEVKHEDDSDEAYNAETDLDEDNDDFEGNSASENFSSKDLSVSHGLSLLKKGPFVSD